MRENTLVVFHSDNGGARSAAATGEVDTSHGTIPCDNGPYRDGKTTVYEGGTRVVALANWPGKVSAGAVDQPIHVVDMFPTLAGLAGAPLEARKPRDGVDVWPTIAAGKPSPRDEVVYNIEPTGAGIRQGDWKLVWRATLPSQVELFDVTKDASETTNLADQNREKVAELQQRAEALSRESVPPLLTAEVTKVAQEVLTGSTSLPTAK
jgi:arylsulfatase A-like enzyme